MVDLVKVNLRVNTDKTLLNEGSWLEPPPSMKVKLFAKSGLVDS